MVDALIVVGSPNSSNSQRLKEVAERAGCPLRGAGAARRGHRLGAASTASASTRHHGRRLGARGAGRGDHRRLRRALRRCASRPSRPPTEDVFFPLPRALRDIAAAGRALRRSEVSPPVDPWPSTPKSPTRSSQPSSPATTSASCSPTRASPRGSRTRTSCCTPSGGYFILTLYEKRVAAADLPFFLGLMEHLAARGLTCPQPVQDRGRRRRSARSPAGRPRSSPSSTACGSGGRARRIAPALGQALAELHLAGADFPHAARQRALGRRLAAAVCGRPRRAPTACSPGSRARSRPSSRILAAHWPRDLPQGVIHADLFPDNVFFLGDRLSGLIDFYFACTDTLAYDVAICLNAWCFEADHSFNVTKGRALLAAYAARAAALGRRASTRCRCWRAARRCASC